MIRHEIENDIYKIYVDGEVKLEIRLDERLDQINIYTDKEVWSGPIDFLDLSGVENARK